MTSELRPDTSLALVALAAAQHVAPYLRSVARTAPETAIKMDIHDPVTVHDQHTEKTLREFLAGAVPGSRVLGEEYGEEVLPPSDLEEQVPGLAAETTMSERAEKRTRTALANVLELGDRVRWIVDPIDGTANFAAGMTYFGTSIGVELDGHMVAGVITIPCDYEAYVADAENFWFVDRGGIETALYAEGPSEESGALLASYYPSRTAYEADIDTAAARELKLLNAYSVVRKPGAAALDLAQVAAGWMGVSMGVTFGPWDVAAGLHMVRVAGGNTVNLAMGTDLPDGLRPGVVAAGRNLDPVTAKEILYEVERERSSD